MLDFVPAFSRTPKRDFRSHMSIRVFSVDANPAIDKPFYFLNKRSDADHLVSMKRATWRGTNSLQLLQLHFTEGERGNYSGGDPAAWIIAGQTPRDGPPGFPHYSLLNTGQCGLNS